MARKRTAQEIDAEIARLQKEREHALSAERAGVVARMKEAIAYYQITAQDLGLGTGVRKRLSAAPKPKRAGRGVGLKAKPAASRVKYKDDAGHTWSGFGPRPKWLVEALANGKSEEDLRA
ncbi:H-NS histone family protein [Roseateles flavus]|uniref:H-NS histone family protein n=1 Tax=Roseateles flavus TaxID=3149041 RepID=A0ABV0GGF9_9BURK